MNVSMLKPRPYWHVDAKWICGLAMLASGGAALLLLTLASVTTPSRGIEFSATLVASLFSKDGLDAPIDTAELQKKLAASPNGKIAPLESFPNVTISKEDLNLAPRELRLKLFRQVAQPIYELGVGGAAEQFTSDRGQQEQFKKDAVLLSVFTQQTNGMLVRYGLIALGAAVLFLAGVAYFSRRWGRLANPGLLLLISGLPGVAVWFILGHGENMKVLEQIPSSLTPMISAAFQQTYVPVAGLGAALIVIAGISKLVSALRDKPAT